MHRPHADAEGWSDFLVQETLAQVTEDLLFPGSKLIDVVGFLARMEQRGNTLKILSDTLHDLGRGKRFFDEQTHNRLEHLFRRGAFQEVAGGTTRRGLE